MVIIKPIGYIPHFRILGTRLRKYTESRFDKEQSA